MTSPPETASTTEPSTEATSLYIGWNGRTDRFDAVRVHIQIEQLAAGNSAVTIRRVVGDGDPKQAVKSIHVGQAPASGRPFLAISNGGGSRRMQVEIDCNADVELLLRLVDADVRMTGSSRMARLFPTGVESDLRSRSTRVRIDGCRKSRIDLSLAESASLIAQRLGGTTITVKRLGNDPVLGSVYINRLDWRDSAREAPSNVILSGEARRLSSDDPGVDIWTSNGGIFIDPHLQQRVQEMGGYEAAFNGIASASVTSGALERGTSGAVYNSQTLT